jgi:putative FmdB family regulatory protein
MWGKLLRHRQPGTVTILPNPAIDPAYGLAVNPGDGDQGLTLSLLFLTQYESDPITCHANRQRARSKLSDRIRCSSAAGARPPSRRRSVLRRLARNRIMPTYEYFCPSCDKKWDALQRLNDAPLTLCPTCGAPNVKRQFSVPSVFTRSKASIVRLVREPSFGGSALDGTRPLNWEHPRFPSRLLGVRKDSADSAKGGT